MSDRSGPKVYVAVLGYNHAADTVECLHSILASDYPDLPVVFIDNGSEEADFQKVVDEVPGIDVLRFPDNVGVEHGFNAGMIHGLRAGAEYVLIINNDTKVDPGAIRLMVEAADRDPKAGIVVPKVFYYDHPEAIWSAGSRFRAFPPTIVHKKTTGPDDGRFDKEIELDCACTCAALLRTSMLKDIGLFDTVYHVYCDDYDLCLRASERGYKTCFAPESRIWHKISMSTGANTPNPSYWRTWGRSEAIFCRKFRSRYPWHLGWAHLAYVAVRIIAERQYYGIKPFLEGMRAGRTAEIPPEPRWDDEPVHVPRVVRTR